MKLLIISPHYPEIFGGVSDYTYHLSKTLAKMGFEVYVLTSKDEKIISEKSEFNLEGHVNVLPIIKSWGFIGISHIIKETKKINPDYIILQYVGYMYQRYGVPLNIPLLVAFLRLSRIKIITTFHEVAIRFNFKNPLNWAIAFLQRLVAYSICLLSHRIVVTIEYFKKMLKAFNRKIIRIPVGPSIRAPELSQRELELLREKIADKIDFIISTFGSCAPWRRSDILLKAINKCYKTRKNIKVLIIGREGHSERFKCLLKELQLEPILHITGFLEHEEIYKYLAISDLFVMLDTDDYGGISTKSTALASAYSAELPIIGNRGLLTDDFFVHGENIYLINQVNPDEVCRAISELMDNKDLRQKLRYGSKKTYENFLKWGKIGEKYKEILNELI